MFVPLFRRHRALIHRAFQDVSPEELQQLEGVLKKVGKRAKALPERVILTLDKGGGLILARQPLHRWHD